MLKDEFSRLISLFAEVGEGKVANIAQVLSETFTFFEHLNLQLKNGTDDQKKDALRMMNELYAELTKVTSKMTGRSQPSDNPSDYTEENWRLLEETKSRLSKVEEALIASLTNLNLPKPEGSKGPFPVQQPPKNDKSSKKPKKSDWMRS